MTDRYLNADEARQVNDYTREYFENPPDTADPILDDLDRTILKSEGFPTLETVNGLSAVRNREHAQRAEQVSISPKVAQAVMNDDVMADLDDAIAQHVRDNAPLGTPSKRSGRR